MEVTQDGATRKLRDALDDLARACGAIPDPGTGNPARAGHCVADPSSGIMGRNYDMPDGAAVARFLDEARQLDPSVERAQSISS